MLELQNNLEQKEFNYLEKELEENKLSLQDTLKKDDFINGEEDEKIQIFNIIKDKVDKCNEQSKELDLSGIGITDEFVLPIFEKINNNFPNLNSLNLSLNNITTLSTLKGKGPFNITSLDLSKNNNLTTLEGLEEFPNLSSLDLSLNNITNLSNLRGKGPFNITSLNLRNNNLTILEGLEEFPNLTSLNLFKNSLINLKGLENLSNLDSLTIGKNNITSLEELKKLTNLKTLIVNYGDINNYEDLGILEDLTNLEIIDFKGTQIGSITKLPKLENVKEVSFCNSVIDSFEGIEEKFPNLEYIDVSYISKNKLKGLLGLQDLNFMKISNEEIISGKDEIEKYINS